MGKQGGTEFSIPAGAGTAHSRAMKFRRGLLAEVARVIGEPTYLQRSLIDEATRQELAAQIAAEQAQVCSRPSNADRLLARHATSLSKRNAAIRELLQPPPPPLHRGVLPGDERVDTAPAKHPEEDPFADL